MPAEVDTMMWLKEDGAPWHGLGVCLEEPPASGHEAMIAAGLDWKVSAVPQLELLPADAYMESGQPAQTFKVMEEEERQEEEGEEDEEEWEKGPSFIEREYEGRLRLSNQRAIYRTDTWDRLAYVGSSYGVLNNSDAFQFFDDAIGEGKVQYRVAGALRGGRIIWILASLPDSLVIGGDDEVERFLLFATSHDGTMAVWIMVTPIRVVCHNTLTAALGENVSHLVNRIWHTRGVNGRLVDYAQVLAHVDDVYQKTGQMFETLSETQLTVSAYDAFMDEMFPLPPHRPHKMEATRDRVTELFEGAAMGSDLGSSKGTAWGLYNAVAEWADHERGQDRSRLHQAWMGEGAKIKERAMWHLMKLTE